MAELEDVESVVHQIERLLEENSRADPAQQRIAEEAIRLLMRLYGAGLSRMMEILHENRADEVSGKIADDKLLASLLLLHGLHPVSAETRVREALHRAQKRLDGHRLVLDGISEGVAHVTLERNGSGRLPADLSTSIERAIAESAPELDGVRIAGLMEAAPLVQIEMAPAR